VQRRDCENAGFVQFKNKRTGRENSGLNEKY
jgi:hypothetical protein